MVVAELTGGPLATPLQYQKHMTHHLLPTFPRRPLSPLRHAFLVRDPERVLTSYAKVREEPTLEDLGLPQQVELFETFGGPVVDAADVLRDPRATLTLLCDALGIGFDAAMLAWPAGPRRHRRRVGAALVRRRRGVDRLRAVLPRLGRPAARPARVPAGAVPSLLRRAGAVPPHSPGVLMLQTFDERNRDLIVGIDDRLVHRDEAGVSPFDSVVQGGDAVWEGLRLHQGRIFKLAEHLARLRRSAQALAFASIPSDEEITERIRAVWPPTR